MRRFVSLWFAIACAALPLMARQSAPQAPARNVILITIDGLRWQEFFGGADRDYFKRDKNGSGGEPERRFWRETKTDRREALMPFMWKAVAAKGQVFGDPESGSLSHVTNGLWFSYPGYSEMFVGAPDPKVDSNNKVPNPNITVLEWLNARPGFAGHVAAFGSWDVLPSILNTERSKLQVGTGWTPVPGATTDRDRSINQLATDLPRYWDYGPFDAPLVYAAIESLRTSQPRVLYLMLGEGDEWAHEGKYDLYLDATFRADRFIQRIWDTVQSLPAYRDRTALIVTTDHGRGATRKDWTDHGKDVPAAEQTWMAVIGPGVPALGVRKSVTVTTSQIAATMASLVGEQFKGVTRPAASALPLREQPTNVLTSAERTAGWRLLFDGSTTKGWHAFGTGKTADASGWSVANGTLIALGEPANVANDIVTDDEYENFELVVDWKLSPQANSGIFFDVVEQGYKEIYATGPEYQLIDEDGWPGKLEDWQKTGANYAMQPPLAKAIKSVGEWNHTRIVVDRGHVTGWTNDIKTAEYQMWTPEWNALRLAGKWKDYPGYGQAHSGKLGLQNHGNKIWFRDIKVRMFAR